VRTVFSQHFSQHALCHPLRLFKLCSVLGTPTSRSWPDGIKLASAMSFKFPQFSATPLASLIPNASPEALDLMTQVCCTVVYDCPLCTATMSTTHSRT
jgi:hypothetical protein